MTDRTNKHQYDVFISYARDSSDVASTLERELLQSARKVGQPISVFRDQTGLALGDLSQNLMTALERSRYLVVVNSRGALDSKWVNKEIEYWFSLGRDASDLRLVRGDSAVNMEWQDGSFANPTHLPQKILENTLSEPLHADLHDLKRRIRTSHSNRVGLAQLVASVLDDVEPGDFLSADYRERKRIRRFGYGTAAVLLLLGVISLNLRRTAARASADAGRVGALLDDQNQAGSLLAGADGPGIGSVRASLDAVERSDAPVLVDGLRAAVSRPMIYRSYELPADHRSDPVRLLGRRKETLLIAVGGDYDKPSKEVKLDLATGDFEYTPYERPFPPSVYRGDPLGFHIDGLEDCANTITQDGGSPPKFRTIAGEWLADLDLTSGVIMSSDCLARSIAFPDFHTWLGSLDGHMYLGHDGHLSKDGGEAVAAPFHTNGGSVTLFSSSDGTVVATQPIGVGGSVESSLISVTQLESLKVTPFPNPRGSLVGMSPDGKLVSIQSGQSISVLDVEGQVEIARFDSQYVDMVFISNDHVALVGDDGTIDLAAIPSIDGVAQPKANCSSVYSAGVSHADGATVSTDGPGNCTSFSLDYTVGPSPVKLFMENPVCAAAMGDATLVAFGLTGHIGDYSLELGHGQNGEFVSDWKRSSIDAATVSADGNEVWWIDSEGVVWSKAGLGAKNQRRFQSDTADWIAAGGDTIALARTGGVNDWNLEPWPPTVAIYSESGSELASFRVWIGRVPTSGVGGLQACVSAAAQDGGRVVAYDGGCHGVTPDEEDHVMAPASLPCTWCGNLETLKRRAETLLALQPPVG
ncbi:MAG: TIR domain-containing protein [Microthrixaceae bacterium]